MPFSSWVAQKNLFVAVPLLAIPFTLGCIGGSGKIEMPAVSPATATAKAMELYDADKNGSLSRKELEKSPAMLKFLSRWDADKDKSISAAEMQQRLERFMNSQIGVMATYCTVMYNGAPLANAEVLFEPEPYFEGAITPALGTTNETGQASMTLDPAKAPDQSIASLGMQVGVFRVIINHPTVKIPAKYNTETELGVEISPIDQPSVDDLTFELKGR